jgi:hypothetical protein
VITIESLRLKLLQGLQTLNLDLLNKSQVIILKEIIQETLEKNSELEAILCKIILQANLLSNQDSFLDSIAEQANRSFKPYMQNELVLAISDFFEPDSLEATITKNHLQSIFISTLTSQINALLLKQFAGEFEETAPIEKSNETRHVSFLTNRNVMRSCKMESEQVAAYKNNMRKIIS